MVELIKASNPANFSKTSALRQSYGVLGLVPRYQAGLMAITDDAWLRELSWTVRYTWPVPGGVVQLPVTDRCRSSETSPIDDAVTTLVDQVPDPMPSIAAGPSRAECEGRVRVDVPAGEVVFGDLVRDCGVLRRVVRVEPLVVSWSLLLFFDPWDGVARPALPVPFGELVTVWRAPCGSGAVAR